MERSVVLAAPGPLDARTGGYIYNARIADGLRDHGWRVELLELDASQTFADVPTGTIVIADSLALDTMADVIERESSRLRIVALMHQPRGTTAECRALRAASLIVVTGTAALPLIERCGVPAGRVVVVEPGTDRPPLPSPRQATPGATTELLTVATLNAGKGHETLLRALASLREAAWRLTCAGSLTREPTTAERVRATAASLRIADRVTFAGELDATALAGCYGRADVFVLATRHETYGMAVAEALAHGLPVVATTTGAIPALVGNEAGLLVPVDDDAALGAALARVIGDAPLRQRLAEGARRRREALPTWADAARRLADALQAVRVASARG